MPVDHVDHESKLLLPANGDEHAEAFDCYHQRELHHHPQKTSRAIIITSASLYVPLLLGFLWFMRTGMAACQHPDLLPCELPSLCTDGDLTVRLNETTAPALESGAVEYEARRIKVLLQGNPFAGDPSPESDEAWHDMFESKPFAVL